MFDRLCLLSKGEVAYSGRTEGSLAWFRQRGYECEQGVNPLDFLVDISSVDFRDEEKEQASRERVDTLVAAWKARSLDEKEPSRTTRSQVDDVSPLQRSPEEPPHAKLDPPSHDPRRPSILAQTTILLKRSHLNVYRNVPQLFGFAAQAVVIGLLMGLTFYQLGESPADVQSASTACIAL